MNSAARTSRAADRFARTVALVGGLVFALAGLWALIGPRSFFDSVATFEPYNQHFIQDIGAFQIGLGTVLLLAALAQGMGVLGVALAGVGIGSAAHLISHIVGIDLGGQPEVDIPSLMLLTLALLGAAAARARSA